MNNLLPENTNYKRQSYFNSIYELAHKAISEAPNEDLRPTELNSRICSEIGGTTTIEEAYELLQEGWKAGETIINNATIKYAEIFTKWFPKQDFGNCFVKSNSGGTVNIEAAINGEPEQMLEMVVNESTIKASQRGKLQRIIVNCDCSGSIAATTILNRGAIISALINTLELASFDTEVIVAFRCLGDNNIDLTYYAIVKAFGSPLILSDLAFALAHPAMLRRFIFSLNEQEKGPAIVTNLIRIGYGRTADLSVEQILYYGTETGVSLGYGNLYFDVIHFNHSPKEMIDNCAQIVQKHFTRISLGGAENNLLPDTSTNDSSNNSNKSQQSLIEPPLKNPFDNDDNNNED